MERRQEYENDYTAETVNWENKDGKQLSADRENIDSMGQQAIEMYRRRNQYVKRLRAYGNNICEGIQGAANCIYKYYIPIELPSSIWGRHNND